MVIEQFELVSAPQPFKTQSKLAGFPALVLNADYRPLSYYPLSVWSWQDAVKAVYMDRVEVVAEYDHAVHSPSFEMRLPSVISLKEYVQQDRAPAFTRFNLFLRDGFKCAYCHATDDLTFDHVIPRSKGGKTTWENIVTACSPCNLRKGGAPTVRMWPQQPIDRPHTHSTLGQTPWLESMSKLVDIME